MSYYNLCVEGDIIIDHGNSNFKDLDEGQKGLAKLGVQYIDCGTSGGVYGLERGYCLMVGGTDTAVSACALIFRTPHQGLVLQPAQTLTQTQHLLSMVGYIVVDLVQVTL